MGKKYDFNRIALMWRLQRGRRRICIGWISVPQKGEGLQFQYFREGVLEAKKEDPNFDGYPGLPIDSNTFSSKQISEIFFGRLINNSRNDANDFYDFWLVDKDKRQDSLYVLAQTQGLSYADMFEFVPHYFKSRKNSFITDIAGLSQIDFDLSSLREGQSLEFTREPDNQFDNKAVYVSYNGKKIGYIKKGHNTVFDTNNSKGINLSIWNVNDLPGFEKLYVRVDIKR